VSRYTGFPNDTKLQAASLWPSLKHNSLFRRSYDINTSEIATTGTASSHPIGPTAQTALGHSKSHYDAFPRPRLSPFVRANFGDGKLTSWRYASPSWPDQAHRQFERAHVKTPIDYLDFKFGSVVLVCGTQARQRVQLRFVISVPDGMPTG
jgi:hypothetical protein